VFANTTLLAHSAKAGERWFSYIWNGFSIKLCLLIWTSHINGSGFQPLESAEGFAKRDF
jgi:hypothetical protein